MDCSLPGPSVHGIFQARILEWVAISFSRGSSQPRDWTWVSLIVGRRFTVWSTREMNRWLVWILDHVDLLTQGLGRASSGKILGNLNSSYLLTELYQGSTETLYRPIHMRGSFSIPWETVEDVQLGLWGDFKSIRYYLEENLQWELWHKGDHVGGYCNNFGGQNLNWIQCLCKG